MTYVPPSDTGLGQYLKPDYTKPWHCLPFISHTICKQRLWRNDNSSYSEINSKTYLYRKCNTVDSNAIMQVCLNNSKPLHDIYT